MIHLRSEADTGRPGRERQRAAGACRTMGSANNSMRVNGVPFTDFKVEQVISHAVIA